MSDAKPETSQQKSASGGGRHGPASGSKSFYLCDPELDNLAETPMLVYCRRPRSPRPVSPPRSGDDESDDGEGKSISSSPKKLSLVVVDGANLHREFCSGEPETVSAAVEDENNHQRSTSGGEGGRRYGPTSELTSLTHMEMANMSQSDQHHHHSLRSTAFDVNIVLPEVNTVQNSTDRSDAFEVHDFDNLILPEVNTVQTSTMPDLLQALALSFPRRPRSGLRVAAPRNEEVADAQPTEQELSFNGEREDSSGEMVVVNVEGESQRKKRKRKSKGANENDRELEGLSVINVNGEVVDLKFLACVGDGAYEAELARMTAWMSREKLVGFMKHLEGEWCGRSERRKLVDAAEFVRALPSNWKIELALRHRAGVPSLYCRSYVSPTDIRFTSCKDAAFYLRDQALANVADPPKEEGMRQKKNGHLTAPQSQVNKIVGSSASEANVNLPETDNLYEVNIANLIECSPCGLAFEDMRGLEKHLLIFHKNTTRRFDLPTSEGTGPHAVEKHSVRDRDEPSPDGATVHQNGQGLSSLPKLPEAQESAPIINGKFKTNCTWCNKEFLHEPVDAETMADASGFMCPECKEEISGGLERSLSRCYQH